MVTFSQILDAPADLYPVGLQLAGMEGIAAADARICGYLLTTVTRLRRVVWYFWSKYE
jgi:hypothetical protein